MVKRKDMDMSAMVLNGTPKQQKASHLKKTLRVLMKTVKIYYLDPQEKERERERLMPIKKHLWGVI